MCLVWGSGVHVYVVFVYETEVFHKDLHCMLIALQMKYTCTHTQQVFTSDYKKWERSRELFREQASSFQVG